MSTTPCNTFGINFPQICKTSYQDSHKKQAHILQKLEGLLDFGFLPLSAAFFGVEEVVSHDILNIRMHVCVR